MNNNENRLNHVINDVIINFDQCTRAISRWKEGCVAASLSCFGEYH